MSLLWMEYESEFEHLVEKAYARESSQKAAYFNALSQRVRKIIYRDTRYNVDYLYTSYMLNDERVMTSYAVWLYGLMDGILKELTPAQTAEYVVHHLEAIRQTLPEAVSPDKQEILNGLLVKAQGAIREYVRTGAAEQPRQGKYEQEIGQYMDFLRARDTRKAVALVREFLDKGISLPDMVGILCGATTNTPALGAAQQTLKDRKSVV